jgi:hypothetical protein
MARGAKAVTGATFRPLVRRAIPAVEQALFASQKPVLLIHPGLLARYDQIDLLAKLRQACEWGDGAPGFIVLVPSDGQTPMPVIDGVPVPVVYAFEWARLTDTWLANGHRADAP